MNKKACRVWGRFSFVVFAIKISCDFEYNPFGTSGSLWLFTSPLRCNPSLLRDSFYFNSQLLRVTGMLSLLEKTAGYHMSGDH